MNWLHGASNRASNAIGVLTSTGSNFTHAVSRKTGNLWNSVRKDGPTAFLVSSVNYASDSAVRFTQCGLDFAEKIPAQMKRNPNFAFGFILSINLVFFKVVDKFLSPLYEKMKNEFSKNALFGSAFTVCNLALRKVTGFNALSNIQIIAISIGATILRYWSNARTESENNKITKYLVQLQQKVFDAHTSAKATLEDKLQKTELDKRNALDRIKALNKVIKNEDAAKKEKDAALIQLEQARENAQTAQVEIEGLKKELETANQDLQQAQQAQQESDRQLKALTQELANANQDLQQAQQAQQESDRQLKELTQELADAKQAKDVAQNAFEKLKSKIQSAHNLPNKKLPGQIQTIINSFANESAH